MRRSHERVYCHFRARVHLTLLITTDDCGAFQVENEALTGTLQRMSVQSNQDQMEIQRLSNDLAQGKARVIELQDMVGVLRKASGRHRAQTRRHGLTCDRGLRLKVRQVY